MDSTSKYLLGMCIIFLLLSCRSQKTVTKVENRGKVIIENADPEAIFTTGHSFNTLKAKRMNVYFEINGIKDNFNGNMAVQRDSLIAISIIPLLGYEAFRILCSKDSIILINRTDKTYHASSLDYYLKKYNIPTGFDELQAVLANEIFYYKAGYDNIKYKKEFAIARGKIILIIEAVIGNVKLANQEITADSTCQNIRDVFLVDYWRDVRMKVKYDDFNGCKMTSFPNKITVNIQDKSSTVNINIEYGQVIFDDEINVKFTIPDGYSRIFM